MRLRSALRGEQFLQVNNLIANPAFEASAWWDEKQVGVFSEPFCREVLRVRGAGQVFYAKEGLLPRCVHDEVGERFACGQNQASADGGVANFDWIAGVGPAVHGIEVEIGEAAEVAQVIGRASHGSDRTGWNQFVRIHHHGVGHAEKNFVAASVNAPERMKAVAERDVAAICVLDDETDFNAVLDELVSQFEIAAEGETLIDLVAGAD